MGRPLHGCPFLGGERVLAWGCCKAEGWQERGAVLPWLLALRMGPRQRHQPEVNPLIPSVQVGSLQVFPLDWITLEGGAVGRGCSPTWKESPWKKHPVLPVLLLGLALTPLGKWEPALGT